MPAWLLVALAILTVARLTRLVTDDTLTSGARARIAERNPSGYLTTLVTCPWCVSFWIGIVVAVVTVWWGDNRAVIAALLVFAASHVTGLQARWAEA